MLITVIELLVLLLALYLGSRYGSLALGAIAGLGLAILVFDHGLKPGTPPPDVIYIIVAASKQRVPAIYFVGIFLHLVLTVLFFVGAPLF